jgi:hypothetical protein
VMGSSASSERRGQASQGTVNLIFVCQHRTCLRPRGRTQLEEAGPVPGADRDRRAHQPLVDELVHGRIAMVSAIIERTGESEICRKA